MTTSGSDLSKSISSYVKKRAKNGLRTQNRACSCVLRESRLGRREGSPPSSGPIATSCPALPPSKLVSGEALKAENKTKRVVAINDALFPALKAQISRSKSDWVFVKRDNKAQLKSIRTAFETARDNAKLSREITPHVLRHSFASRLVKAGVDLRTVQELGGWSSLAIAQRYSHPDEEHKMAAVQLIAKNSTTVSTQAAEEESRP